MTLFRFVVTDGSGSSQADPVDLADVEKAKSDAVKMAGQILKDLDGRFWSDTHWCLGVSDLAGVFICAIKIVGDLAPPAVR